MTLYPSTFHVAHKLFIGVRDKPVWGDILDGPEASPGQVLEAIIDTFYDEEPTTDTLRVWFMDGIRYHDMTQSFIAAYNERMEKVA